MPTNRVPMRKVKRILELHFVANLSVRAIARSVGVGRSSVSRILERARVVNVTWPPPDTMTDAKLEALLYPVTARGGLVPRPIPNWVEVRQQLATHRSLTLFQLWTEYIEANPTGYQYSHFCELYRTWRGTQVDPVMRLTHKAGERLFVDYSGKKPCVVDPHTGEVHQMELFVAALGTSGYLYAEATETQTAADFCGSIRRTFEFLGGVPRLVVPDNLKSAIIKFRKDDTPVLNESFRDLTEHYQVGALPARPRKPRDKAKAESSVLMLQRRVLGALRNRTFTSLAELNAAILEQVQDLNHAPFQKMDTSRQRMFEELDRPALRPLPTEPYEYGQWTDQRKVAFNYHIQVEKHFYSVPHQYLGSYVRARIQAKTVEIYRNQTRITSHVRDRAPGKYTTNHAHMPKNHKEHGDWTPSRFVNWAKRIGPSTGTLIEQNLASAQVPAQVYSRCMGILKLESTYGPATLERACQIALERDQCSSAAIRRLVKRIADERPAPPPIEHENLRGANYYSTNSTT